MQGFPFDLGDRFPGAEELDDLGLEQADHGLGQGIVIAVAYAANRGVDAGIGEALGVADRQVLAAAIRVVDQSAPLCRTALTDSQVIRI